MPDLRGQPLRQALAMLAPLRREGGDQQGRGVVVQQCPGGRRVAAGQAGAPDPACRGPATGRGSMTWERDMPVSELLAALPENSVVGTPPASVSGDQ